MFVSTDSRQVLLQDHIKILYPPISGQAMIECDCVNASCDSVYWFRSNPTHGHFQYLGKYNNADRPMYHSGVNNSHFKFSKKASACFVLRVLDVQKEDGGIYSCVLKDKSNTEIWRTGSFLQPGGLCFLIITWWHFDHYFPVVMGDARIFDLIWYRLLF